MDFLPDASVSRVLILLFVIPPCITFCTRLLLRPLPSWYSNQQQQHFHMGRDTGCYTLQALSRDCLCIFIIVSLGKIQKKNPHNRSKGNTKPLIPNSLLTVQGMLVHHCSRSWAWTQCENILILCECQTKHTRKKLGKSQQANEICKV